jgi:DNA-binding NarL/FixJ family response regulator
MYGPQTSNASRWLAPLAAVLVSQIRLLSDCLIAAFAQDPRVKILSYCSTAPQAFQSIIETKADIVLFDARFPRGMPVVSHIRAATPWVRVVALAVNETEDNVLSWVNAGASGYVADTAPLEGVTDLVFEIVQGKQACSTEVTGALLRRMTGHAAPMPAYGACPSLTNREREILRLVGFGMSNKEIARELKISLATTKAHMHNLLAKLNIRRRGEAAAWMHGLSNGLESARWTAPEAKSPSNHPWTK